MEGLINQPTLLSGEPAMPDPLASLRDHLRDFLLKGNAHLDFDKATEKLPVDLRGAKLPDVPHSPWRLVEHMRIAQWDILEFCRNPQHQSPEFPDGYWPQSDAPPDDLAWDKTIARFRSDRQAMVDLIESLESDLFAPILGGDGQTLLQEALLIADHNAYHLGELVVVRRGLGAWSE